MGMIEATPLLLRALRCQPTERVPVWLMRQAGRSDPEYMAYRERSGKPLEELFRSVEDMVAISLLPRRLGVDALILFQDILTPLDPMGAKFVFRPGPQLVSSSLSPGELPQLKPLSSQRQLTFVRDAILAVLDEIGGELPLLGFAGAPLTLIAFLLEGGSPPDLKRTLALAQDHPCVFGELMKRLTDATIDYLRFQIESGVHAVQLFESLGHLVPKSVYECFVQPSHQRIFAALKGTAPTILFVRGSPWLDAMVASGADALSVASHVQLASLQRYTQGRMALQGNIDHRLLCQASLQDIVQAVHVCLEQTNGQGHILNLSHGLLKDTPFENVQQLVTAVKNWRPQPKHASVTVYPAS